LEGKEEKKKRKGRKLHHSERGRENPSILVIELRGRKRPCAIWGG